MVKIKSQTRILSFIVTFSVALLVIGFAVARSSNDNYFNGFWGSTHANCHGSDGPTTLVAGTITIMSSSGSNVNPSEVFVVSATVSGFVAVPDGDDISIGFPIGYVSYNPNGRGNNKNFTWNATAYHGVVVTGGNAPTKYYQITAPITPGTYILTADAIRADNLGTRIAIAYITANYTITVETPDTTPPTISNIVESADPLELGQTETISADITDISGVNQVFLEFDTLNHTMSFVSGSTYQYTTWTPSSVGTKNYVIWADDTKGNIGSSSGSILIQDTIVPLLSNLIKSADPLLLGLSENISIDTSDLAGINQVLIEFEGLNHTMAFVSGNTWQYTNWIPSSSGVKIFTIYAQDNNGNWNSTSDSITVQSNTGPILTNILESNDPLELGNIETFSVDVSDGDGVSVVLLLFDGINHTMTNVGGNTWQYSSWTPGSVGSHAYIIYANDSLNFLSSYSGGIDVIDTTSPSLAGLVENADPLELGQVETINITVSDLSGINEVLLEFDGINHTMTNIGGNIYQYSLWTPASTGVKSYTIYAKDNHNNWNSLAGSISVQDTTAPTITNLVESADPLELGQTEIISVDVSDLSSVSQVLIEFNALNHTMSLISGNTYQYTTWTPSSVGTKNYMIWAQDSNGNWRSSSGSILIQDTIAPLLSNLIKSADPLQLGLSENISIDITDLADISQVLIEFEGLNHTMAFVSGNTWQYTNWIPSSNGVKIFTIYAQDNNGNWNSTSGSITVQSNTAPSLTNILESNDPLELGNIETISVDVSDGDGVSVVLLLFDGINHTMTNVGGNTWQYSSWTPGSVGSHAYIIYANDSLNFLSSYSGGIDVIDTTSPSLAGLVENADPLELGQVETINITVSDLSGINEVLLEFDGINHTMTNIGGNIYQYSLWTPASTGVKSYTIYAKDNHNNWNSLAGSILVQDTLAPLWDTLIENSDPLNVGEFETISINGYDLNGISQILVEFDGLNHSLSFISGNTWNYTWKPVSTGILSYTIFILDNNNNLNSTAGSITIVDIGSPNYGNLSVSSNPSQIGAYPIFTIDVDDLSGISQVVINIGGTNRTMTNLTGNRYQYNSWTTTSTGSYNFTIYMCDNNNNWNSTNGVISFIDTIAPQIANIQNNLGIVYLGKNFKINLTATDISGIMFVLIEFDGHNHTMSYITSDLWFYSEWMPTSVGTYAYRIFATDSNNNIATYLDTINVIDDEPPLILNTKLSKSSLKIGETVKISLNAKDKSGITSVQILISGKTYNMTQIDSETWEYEWVAEKDGAISYYIKVIDANNNTNTISGLIQVNTLNIYDFTTTPVIIAIGGIMFLGFSLTILNKKRKKTDDWDKIKSSTLK